MKTAKRLALLLFLAPLTLAPARAGYTTYIQSVSRPVSTLTISAGASGMASQYFGVEIADDYGKYYLGDKRSSCGTNSLFCHSISASTYSVTIDSFNSSVFPNGFTGRVRLKGPVPASDTSSGNDFAPATNYGGTRITVCAACGDSANGAVAVRTVGGRRYAEERTSYVTATGSCTDENNPDYPYLAYVYVYISSATGRITFSSSVDSAACLTNPVGADIGPTASLSYWPADVAVYLGIFAQYAHNHFHFYSDNRPWAP